MSNEEAQREDWFRRNAQYIEEVQFEAGIWNAKTVQSMQSTVEFGVQGIKACYLLNASGIGVLALAGKDLHLIAPDLLRFSIPFFCGIVTGVLCNLFSYFAQGQYSLMCYQLHAVARDEGVVKYFADRITKEFNDEQTQHKTAAIRHQRIANFFRALAIVFGIISMGGFCVGGYRLIELSGLG